MATKNTKLINPVSRDHFFGYVPSIPKHGFSEGGIILKHGQHRGPNKGFGVEHIWAEHGHQLSTLGFKSKDKVVDFINRIIRPETPIFCEFNDIRGNHRLTVLRTFSGIVVLEPTADEHNNRMYSIVTAFSSKIAHGQLIGRTKSAPFGADKTKSAPKGADR